MSRRPTNDSRNNQPQESAQLSHSERVNLKARQRKGAIMRRNFIIFMVFLIIAVVAGTVISAMFFKINSITVTGSAKNEAVSSYYTKEQIIEASGIVTGKNLITINTGDIESRIEHALPYIGRVSVKRRLPDKVAITVADTSAVYAVETAGGYILLNEYAKTLENPTWKIPDGAALLTGVEINEADPGETCVFAQPSKYEKLSKLRALFSQYGIESVTKINLESDTNIKFVCSDRITCVIGSMNSADSKIRLAAKTIAEQNSKSFVSDIIIDLSFEGTAYVRPDREGAELIKGNEPVTA